MTYMTYIGGMNRETRELTEKGKVIDEVEALVIAPIICLVDIHIPILYHSLPCSRWKLGTIYCRVRQHNIAE